MANETKAGFVIRDKQTINLIYNLINLFANLTYLCLNSP